MGSDKTIMTELEEKIAKLPAWAREHIKRLEAAAEPNNAELRHMRQRVTAVEDKCRKMQGRMDAMTDLMTCAARGGHETAKAYVERVVNEYHEPGDGCDGQNTGTTAEAPTGPG